MYSGSSASTDNGNLSQRTKELNAARQDLIAANAKIT